MKTKLVVGASLLLAVVLCVKAQSGLSNCTESSLRDEIQKFLNNDTLQLLQENIVCLSPAEVRGQYTSGSAVVSYCVQGACFPNTSK